MNEALKVNESQDSSEEIQLLTLDEQVCYAIYSASNAFIRAYRPVLEKLDLTYLQYMTLLVLWEKDGISVKELGEKLGLDSGTLTPLLKRMAGKGLIIREHCLVDERVRIIKLSEKAHTMKGKISMVPPQIDVKVAMPSDQLGDLKELCETATKNLIAAEA